ncbi:hypothetical protein, partial [Pseudomonas sp. MD195_PC81_125]|uniref:hypothetical protein n=1 Tax=Pseudomonas sp. MD195_PC81_125 TaxID=2741560 RepID=UPI001C70C622
PAPTGIFADLDRGYTTETVGAGLPAMASSMTQHKAWPLWHGPCVPVIQVLQKNCRCVNSFHPPQPLHPKVQQIEQ